MRLKSLPRVECNHCGKKKMYGISIDISKILCIVLCEECLWELMNLIDIDNINKNLFKEVSAWKYY